VPESVPSASTLLIELAPPKLAGSIPSLADSEFNPIAPHTINAAAAAITPSFVLMRGTPVEER
jgi:hypothetical protein